MTSISVSTSELTRTIGDRLRAQRQETMLVTCAAAMGLLLGCSSSDDGDPSGDAGISGSASDEGGSGGGSGGTANGGTTNGGGGSGGTSSNAGNDSGGAGGNDTGGSGGVADNGGNAGEGGSGGESGLVLVPPIERAGLHVLEFGDVSFEVDGAHGARIVGFKLDGTNVLTGSDVHPVYYGSTLWTGPESDWASNPYMPVAALDSGAYTMSVDAQSMITADGPNFTAGSKQASVAKTFKADLVNNAVIIEYSLTNEGATAIHLGHWEVTRVPPDGLTFYPTGDASSVPYGAINVEEALGTSWFDHSAYPNGTASKNSADGHDGWVAHVEADAAGPLLFIKQFADVANGVTAPNHREVEIFAAADRSYEEIELHSEYWEIQPGATASWEVRWYLRRLPSNTEIAVGNQALLDAVAAVIQ